MSHWYVIGTVVDLIYLNGLCDLDYQSFKRELTNSLDEDVPDLEELVNIKWDQYGQTFLQLCIGHKAGTSRFVTSASLRR